MGVRDEEGVIKKGVREMPPFLLSATLDDPFKMLDEMAAGLLWQFATLLGM